MKLFIKNMVCPRCIYSIQHLLAANQLSYTAIRLGEVQLVEPLSTSQQIDLSKQLKSLGFELLTDKDQKIVNKIKSFLVEMIHYGKHDRAKKYSVTISQHLHKDYSTISKTFSKLEGITIEKYIMHQKIEKVKELLSYGEMTISAIAFELNYSSAAHLSNQFRKITGLSPSQFKQQHIKSRKSLDEL